MTILLRNTNNFIHPRGKSPLEIAFLNFDAMATLDFIGLSSGREVLSLQLIMDCIFVDKWCEDMRGNPSINKFIAAVIRRPI